MMHHSRARSTHRKCKKKQHMREHIEGRERERERAKKKKKREMEIKRKKEKE